MKYSLANAIQEERAKVSSWEQFSIYSRLVKWRLILLVMVSGAAGYLLGSRGPLDFMLFLTCMTGTGLLASGSLALNQWMEPEYDSKMARTAGRPLPRGELAGNQALFFGLGLITAGALILLSQGFLTTLFLGVLTVLLYLVFYTPMKRSTSWSVYAGAASGSLPPLMGWAAINPRITPEAWSLFAVLFAWQIVHFAAIAWLFREDYRRAGFVFSELKDESGKRTARKAFYWSSALVFFSLAPVWMHLCGRVYLVAAVLLGGGLLWMSIQSLRKMAHAEARNLMLASILYLFALLSFMVFNKI